MRQFAAFGSVQSRSFASSCRESEGKKAKTASKTSKKAKSDDPAVKDANKPAKKPSAANAAAKSSSKGPHSEKPRTKTAADSPMVGAFDRIKDGARLNTLACGCQ